MNFRDDVLCWDKLLNFKFVPDLTLCEAFGVHDNIEEPGALVSVYANFDMAAGCPVETLTVTLTVDESVSIDGAADYQYRMSAEELVTLSQKMDAYYQRKRGFPSRSARGSTPRKRAEKQTTRRFPVKNAGKRRVNGKVRTIWKRF